MALFCLLKWSKFQGQDKKRHFGKKSQINGHRVINDGVNESVKDLRKKNSSNDWLVITGDRN